LPGRTKIFSSLVQVDPVGMERTTITQADDRIRSQDFYYGVRILSSGVYRRVRGSRGRVELANLAPGRTTVNQSGIGQTASLGTCPEVVAIVIAAGVKLPEAEPFQPAVMGLRVGNGS
jgi:hypothetical protein